MVRQRRMSLTAASRAYNIPLSTLSDRVKRPKLTERARVLNLEEKLAVSEFCQYQAEHGRPLRRKDIREHIKVYTFFGYNEPFFKYIIV